MRLVFAAPFLALTMIGADRGGSAWQRTTAPPTSCRAGKDLVVQALERMRADNTAAELADANELLKRAADLCSESGEAWYYRSLVEEKLGHAPVAAYAMRQAHLFSSEALTEGLNPFVLAVPKATSAPPPVRHRWALVVGIGSFRDATVKSLRYSRSDAESFRDVLVDPALGGFPAGNVRLLTDGTATLRAIKESLNWLARSAEPDDLVVVYIASHGSSREVDTAGANYILTHDTEVGAELNPDALYATALPMVELANAVATRVRAQRTAVFLDTCYSGAATEGAGNARVGTGAAPAASKRLAPGVSSASVSASTLRQMDQGAGRVILAASETEEESLESEALQHGYFTYYLVNALRKHPGLQLSEVYAAVRDGVSAKVAKDYAAYGLHQMPVMSRSTDTTDFVLVPLPSTAGVSSIAGPPSATPHKKAEEPLPATRAVARLRP